MPSHHTFVKMCTWEEILKYNRGYFEEVGLRKLISYSTFFLLKSAVMSPYPLYNSKVKVYL